MTTRSILASIDLAEVRRLTVEALLTHAVPDSLICAEYAGEAGVALESYDPGPRSALDPDFLRFVHARADRLIAEDLDILSAQIDENGCLVVHRAMTVPRAWLDRDPDPCGLGQYWAWSEDCAISHHGAGMIEDGIEVRLRGSVRMEDVDWTTTLALNAGDDYVTGTENEIRLRPGAAVALDRIEHRNDIFDDYQPWVGLTNTPVSI